MSLALSDRPCRETSCVRQTHRLHCLLYTCCMGLNRHIWTSLGGIGHTLCIHACVSRHQWETEAQMMVRLFCQPWRWSDGGLMVEYAQSREYGSGWKRISSTKW